MIDFRSDTVTRPSKAMRTAMANAEVGDDVYGDDPTVNELESWAAERHGFASAMFCSSGTQANLLALMAHCQRGDEYLCGQQAHNYKFEGGGAAILGSIQPQPIANEQDGSLCFKKLAAAIKPDDSHFARTTLLSIENTINGKVLPLTYMVKAREFTQQNNLALHLDGARVYNAASALNVDITEICQHVDSVSICLSKGLGAPIGSLLLGSQALIKSAKRWRKVVGGGMRQAGIIAAAAKIALAQNPEKLAQDHINATYLAHALNQFTDISVNLEQVETNMVFAKFSEAVDMANLVDKLKADNILLSAGNPMRLVTHLDIDKTAIDNFIKKLSSALTQTPTSVKVS
ncbi:low-specificity L-threonine aldolase [Colwellia sp. MB02u-9]|uniref:low-specificity L-threonine aldolase n=1 Tax=Colwellia sp. MB02u-9 TaxID=2759823 RepID=UPI0015F4700C|nr:low-specificity L-threonine aldolase [Colwellia sp. MB02u-9]MBA6295630.1 low-specificity L-threonine aldolase [Colwellia sp. MB02u-9]